MEAVLGAIVGIAVSTTCIHWSRSYLLTIRDLTELPRTMSLTLIGVGSLTGVIVTSDLVPLSYILTPVTCLLIVQVPLDVLVQRLARLPTLLTFVLLCVSRVFEAFMDSSWREFTAQIAVTVLTLMVFTTLHWWSPRVLGWGDVLLVAPLALAVSWAQLSSIIIWMLIASCSASLHGVALRWWSGSRYIPFGPHLLGAAWLVVVFSL